MLCHSAIKIKAQFLIAKLRYMTSYPEPVHKIMERYWAAIFQKLSSLLVVTFYSAPVLILQ